MRILISNDDGVYSPGLLALAEAAATFGEVRLVAPDVEQSSMGHAITHSRPLHVRATRIRDFEAFRVNGTPADCVTLGVALWSNVDVVLSGINLGPNLGNSAWHSGTLSAAKQGALLGLRGIALSALTTVDEAGFARLQPHVLQVLGLLLPASELRLVNVNFPEAPKGQAWTRQSVRHYDGRVVASKDPMGREHHWITVVPIDEIEEGSDRWAAQQGLISLTPLHLDLTDDELLAHAQQEYPPPAPPRSTTVEEADAPQDDAARV